MGKQMTVYEKASLYGIIGGILMLLAGVTGAAAWTAIGDLVAEHISDSEPLAMVFLVLALLGSLGGVLVIIGALLLKNKDKRKLGSLLITIGAGFGLIGLIIMVIFALLGGDFMFFTGFGIGMIGLILSIVARSMAKD